MQNESLFNSSDSKQRGVGCDKLCPDDKRLKFKWTWRPFFGKGIPCQISEAELENGWGLETVFWHSSYEARVECHGRSVSNYRVRPDETTKRDSVLVTRLDAQLKAEELFVELAKDLVRQCNLKKED